MTPEQLTALASEINNDPLALGYKALLTAGEWQAVLPLLNELNYTTLGPVSAATAEAWAAAGPYAAIVANASNSTSPVQSSCLAVQVALAGNNQINLPGLQPLFSAWVTAGVITQAQHDALIALGTVPASRATVLGLPVVGGSDLAQAGF